MLKYRADKEKWSIDFFFLMVEMLLLCSLVTLNILGCDCDPQSWRSIHWRSNSQSPHFSHILGVNKQAWLPHLCIAPSPGTTQGDKKKKNATLFSKRKKNEHKGKGKAQLNRNIKFLTEERGLLSRWVSIKVCCFF